MGIATKVEETGFSILASLPKPVRDAGIRSANRVRTAQMQKLETPINVTLYVTNYCNAKCDHCFYWEELNTGKPELTLEDMRKIARSFKQPIRTLMLTGGEPFLRKDMVEICSTFYNDNHTRRININSNGINVGKIVKDVKEILAECPDLYLSIQISIDGPKEMHDVFRKVPGCYDRATDALRQLSAIKRVNKYFAVSMMTTVCQANIDLLPDFVKNMKKEFPDVMHKFNILRGSHLGTWAVPEAVASTLDPDLDKASSVSPEELEKVFDKITHMVAEHTDPVWQNFQKMKWKYSIRMLKTGKRMLNCTASYTYAVIYPDGNVSVCEPTRPFANLHDFDMDFYRLWQSSQAQAMKKEAQKCHCIHPCNLLDSMGHDTNTLIELAGKGQNKPLAVEAELEI